MNFTEKAKLVCDVLGVTDETAYKYVAHNLEIAYFTGQIKSLDEFKKMGTPMESLDENTEQ